MPVQRLGPAGRIPCGGGFGRTRRRRALRTGSLACERRPPMRGDPLFASLPNEVEGSWLAEEPARVERAIRPRMATIDGVSAARRHLRCEECQREPGENERFRAYLTIDEELASPAPRALSANSVRPGGTSLRRSTSSGARYPGTDGVRSGRTRVRVGLVVDRGRVGAARLVQRQGRSAHARTRDEPGQLDEGLGYTRARAYQTSAPLASEPENRNASAATLSPGPACCPVQRLANGRVEREF
jgi:hypothetical protein